MADTKNTGTGHTSWAGPAIGAGVGLIGMLGQKKREKRAVENQKTLMDWQMRNQKHLNEQGHELQMKAWRDTNYPAQMAMMKEAGLNPGLMYGMGGGGGVTTGSQSGGGASGGQAPAPQPMELGTAISSAMMASQIELQKAQAAKTREEAKALSIDNVTKERYGHEADLFEASNRRDKALHEGQYLFENAPVRTRFDEKMEAELEKAKLGVEIDKLVKKGLLDENKVKTYKGKLAEAGIDPDSNPLLREIMKAMAGAGVPLNELLIKAVQWFID